MKLFKAFTLSSIAILLLCTTVSAQKQDEQYLKVVTERAGKIVSKMQLSDAAKASWLQTEIAQQYYNLNTAHTSLGKELKNIKSQSISDSKKKALAAKQTSKSEKKIETLHKKFIAQLSKKLTASEVDDVKNGMTYNVLPITYKAYQDMIPNLTAQQKETILTLLTEAREHAMDAGSSDEKHKWFGKYKGKINNYLSAAGYNLKEEGANWEKRKAAASKTK